MERRKENGGRMRKRGAQDGEEEREWRENEKERSTRWRGGMRREGE
jgi:hypothetical protein